MEELHHNHKETVSGWPDILKVWRASRTRLRIHRPKRVVTPWGRVSGTSF